MDTYRGGMSGGRPRGILNRRFMNVVKVYMKLVGVRKEHAEDWVTWRQVILWGPLRKWPKAGRRKRRHRE